MKKFYSVFGGCLETDVEFPELRITERRDPRWLFAKVASLPTRRDLVEVGDQHIWGECHARLFRHDEGYRITVDDTGTFDVDASGTEILCHEKEGAWPDFVRSHLLGRVLATALFSRGWMPLHGSAVLLNDGVAGFLAPKGFGKSTLALGLVRAGARLVTDDTLPVELSSPPRSWPGVHSVRIKSDSMNAVGIAEADLETREGKGIVTSLREMDLSNDAAPLSALYLIAPFDPSQRNGTHAEAPISREKLTGVPAALSLVANFKLAKMTGVTQMPEVLRRAAAVADVVPVYRLQLPRSLNALPVVAEEILGWHAGQGSGVGGREIGVGIGSRKSVDSRESAVGGATEVSGK